MSTLLLRLAGPMQSWGEESRSVRRETAKAPTKSGVLGMLAAAQGRRRTDDIEDLLSLDFAVRIDQPGRVERDFQTSTTLDGRHSFPLTTRYYLTDAIFLAAVQGDASLITVLDTALRQPRFPLYLGRRSCPPVGPVTLGIREAGAVEVLKAEPWRAAAWWKRQQAGIVDIEMLLDGSLLSPMDSPDQAQITTTHRDAPISFDPTRREYGWRAVIHQQVSVTNDLTQVKEVAPVEGPPGLRHDPMAAFGGA